jgi:hypothetical protein
MAAGKNWVRLLPKYGPAISDAADGGGFGMIRTPANGTVLLYTR